MHHWLGQILGSHQAGRLEAATQSSLMHLVSSLRMCGFHTHSFISYFAGTHFMPSSILDNGDAIVYKTVRDVYGASF